MLIPLPSKRKMMKNKITIIFTIAGIIAVLCVLSTIYFLFESIDERNTLVNEKIHPWLVNEKNSCLSCHSGMKGFESAHEPKKIGCSSCHLGNQNSDQKEIAHKGMILIPGNKSNAEITCGRSGCHPQMIVRMNNNIMNTMNGVVSVDKWVWDEIKYPTAKLPIQMIGFTSSEKHLRNLCASCHLSNEKIEFGPIDELSRGGGCLACHLNYSEDAYEELQKAIPLREGQSIVSANQVGRKLAKYKFSPTVHPQINLDIKNDKCFGCHSRSGRISLSYEGWHETLLTKEDVDGKTGFRILNDGRIVQKIKPDIHFEKGMICTDCHNSYEIMGDGNYALHKEDQLKIQCVDCHLTKESVTKKSDELDFESRKIVELLGFKKNNPNYLIASKNADPLVNTFVENGIPYLIKKTSREIIEIQKPVEKCERENSHINLSCNSCHSSWTPQCIGCHTEFNSNSNMYDLLDNKEANGEWLEAAKDLLAEPSVLGVKEIRNQDGTIKKIIDEMMPGMILTIKKNLKDNNISFRRLYAPAFSHTIRKESRSCESCHFNPLALGYGRGKFEYKILGNTGRFQFIPKYPQSKFDGLPEDAWTGFLKERKKDSATRENIRTLSVSEQKRILTVGSCLTCHKPETPVMKSILRDFNKTLRLRSKKCILPLF